MGCLRGADTKGRVGAAARQDCFCVRGLRDSRILLFYQRAAPRPCMWGRLVGAPSGSGGLAIRLSHFAEPLQARRKTLAAASRRRINNPPLEFVHFWEKVGQTIVFRGLSCLASTRRCSYERSPGWEAVYWFNQLHACVVMPNHVHAIFQRDTAMPTIMRWLKE